MALRTIQKDLALQDLGAGPSNVSLLWEPVSSRTRVFRKASSKWLKITAVPARFALRCAVRVHLAQIPA